MVMGFLTWGGYGEQFLKDNLSRLFPALERELEAVQLRSQHRRATGAMQYLAAIVQSSEDAIYGKSLDSLRRSGSWPTSVVGWAGLKTAITSADQTM